MLLFLLLLSMSKATPVAPQNYYVTFIKGNVTIAPDHKQLAVGQVLHTTDCLEFSGSGDKVALINPAAGRFVVHDKKHIGSESGMPRILVVISENLEPVIYSKILAARNVLNNVEELRSFFKNMASENKDTAAHLLIADSLRFSLSEQGFTNRERKIFFVRYQYHGESINKKLTYIESSVPGGDPDLLLDKDILQVDGKQIDASEISNAQLFYFDTAEKQKEYVSTLQLSFVPAGHLQEEVNVLYRHLKPLYAGAADIEKDIYEAIVCELKEEYGYTDEKSIHTFIQTAQKQ